MTKKQLAAALRISLVQLWRLQMRGMPTDDLQEAIRWRVEHLVQSRINRLNSDTTGNVLARTGNVPEPEVAVPPGAALAEPPEADCISCDTDIAGIPARTAPPGATYDRADAISAEPPDQNASSGALITAPARPVQWRYGQRRPARDRDVWAPRPDAFAGDDWLADFLTRWRP